MGDKEDRAQSASRSDADHQSDDISDEVSDEVSADEETSSSGSSSLEAATDSEEDDLERVDAATASLPTSPPSKIPKIEEVSPTALKTRLASFLPRLKQANAELDNDPNASTKRIDHVADGEEQYIEMSLGLGVLKSRREPLQPDQDIKTVALGDSDSSDPDTEQENESGSRSSQTSIVDKLKGIRPSKRKIQEIN